MSVSFTIQPKVVFSYPSAKDFTDILKVLSEIVEEVLFTVDSKSLSVKALDPSRAAMMYILIPAEAFQEFRAEEELKIGLAVGNLSKVLKNLKKGDKITIGANEESVEILIEGTSIRRYKFRNIEVISEELPELSPQYDVEASALSTALRTVISELSSITSTIGITASKDTLIFVDLDTKKSSYKLATASGSLIALNIKKENVTAAYDSEYLSKVLDILRLGNIVDIKYGSEAPLYLSTEFSGGKAEYYLAAKI
uniref:DNA polymerase sliding clamp n=1 Tax=Ignisphaera aggregans TaxID=334771 RepID=A0A7C4FGS4_9CREN